MGDLKFEKTEIPSERFEPGRWLITSCLEDGRLVSIELGWAGSGGAGEYRLIGDFKHRPEVLFVIRMLEEMSPVSDVSAALSEAGFVKYQPRGLWHGGTTYVRWIREELSALLDFDVNGTRLHLGLSSGVYQAIEIATLPLATRLTALSILGRPEALATTVLGALLSARIAAGDAARPLTEGFVDAGRARGAHGEGT